MNYVILKKSVEGKVIEFLADNPNPPDKKIHDLSDRLKIKTDKFEAKIYGVLSDVIEHGNGVKADPKELAMGIKIEMEHTKYPELAKYISLAHLKEIPDYYTRLKKMEEEAKSINKAVKDSKTITIKCSKQASEDLIRLLEHLKVWGNIGHSGSILADPPYGIKVPKDGKMFGFDGDGSSKIWSIKESE